jgi:TRAP-type C4-dicarboxylate transport system substrate-binding protein
MKRVFIKTVLATLAMAAMGMASAQEKTIKFANQNSAGHPIILGMEKFKEVVEAKSGGKVAHWAMTKPTYLLCKADRWKWFL